MVGLSLAKLEGERRKLLDAYYAGAIDVAMLKTGQERISRQARGVEDRPATIDAHLHEWQVVWEFQPPFDVLSGTAGSEHGSLVEKTCSYSNLVELRDRIGELVACMA